MAKQYIALQPVGRFRKGDVVGGLTDAQIKDLLKNKIIGEKPVSKIKEAKVDG